MARRLRAATVVATTLLWACGTAITVPWAPAAGVAQADSGPCGWSGEAPPAVYDHVIVVVFENKSARTVFGGGSAPYLTGLAASCARGDNMLPLSSTSLANYVALTSGSTGTPKEITSNANPSAWPQSSTSLFEHLGTAAVQLTESQPGSCSMKASGDFVVKHAPLQYYTRINATLCQTQARPLPGSPDLSARYTLVVPNRCHDMHKCPSEPTVASRVRAGDEWASTFVPTLVASAEYRAGRTAIFLTWDEADPKSDRIPFIVVSPYTQPGLVVSSRFDHYSLLKAVQQLLGDGPLLGHAADADTVSLAPAFGLQG